MAELTPFGKAVRKIRIDRAETLGDMAEALQVSPAFLSSIETGRKNVPSELLDKLIDYCSLSPANAKELRHLALQSRDSITLRPKGKSRELAAAFARKFEELDKQQIEEILNVLKR